MLSKWTLKQQKLFAIKSLMWCILEEQGIKLTFTSKKVRLKVNCPSALMSKTAKGQKCLENKERLVVILFCCFFKVVNYFIQFCPTHLYYFLRQLEIKIKQFQNIIEVLWKSKYESNRKKLCKRNNVNSFGQKQRLKNGVVEFCKVISSKGDINRECLFTVCFQHQEVSNETSS